MVDRGCPQWLVILVALSGCDELFGLDPIPLPTDAPADTTRVDTQQDAFVLVCPNDAIANYLFDSTTASFYAFIPTQRQFVDAANDCASHRTLTGVTGHTHLAVVSSQAELVRLFQLSGDSTWVGLTNLEVTPRSWVTAEPAPIPSEYWSPLNGEPNNPVTEQCTNFMDQGRLHTTACTAGNTYICECDTFPNDPTRY